MEAELARDELWKEIAIRDEADRERRQKLARMNDEVVAEARRKKQQLIDTFLKDVVVQLRTTIYEATTDVLKTMQKNQGKLHPRSVVQLKNLIEQIGSLNFFGDEESTPDDRPRARDLRPSAGGAQRREHPQRFGGCGDRDPCQPDRPRRDAPGERAAGRPGGDRPVGTGPCPPTAGSRRPGAGRRVALSLDQARPLELLEAA